MGPFQGFNIILCIASATSIIVIYSWEGFWKHSFSYGQGNFKSFHDKEQSLTILLWTTKKARIQDFYAVNYNYLERCSVKCSFSQDKDLVHEVDAVVAHTLGFKSALPPQRKKNQLRIFLSRESPRTKLMGPSPNSYNWTFTYRRDSDIPIPWGYFERLKPFQLPNQGKSPFRDKSELEDFRQNYLGNKTKLVAGIISHCKTKSKREKYIKALSEHVEVDIYGECGKFNCKESRRERCHKDLCEACYVQLSQSYKFFLAFENSLCIDYVTEKFFDTVFFTTMVPIVYGRADYASLAPPMSYIDTRDFESAGDLAAYLNYLDSHPEEYLKYFLWRESYKAHGANNRWCLLCQRMWAVSKVDDRGARVIDPGYSHVVENITDWWWFIPNSTEKEYVCNNPGK